VFSAMGFYPVCPATDQYVLGTPLFKKVTLKLENGKQFIITAPNNSEANKYVQKIQLKGKAYPNNWINHSIILTGGSLNFDMDSIPNKTRGIHPSTFPFSISTNK